jgi:hypothetical protein
MLIPMKAQAAFDDISGIHECTGVALPADELYDFLSTPSVSGLRFALAVLQ